MPARRRRRPGQGARQTAPKPEPAPRSAAAASVAEPEPAPVEKAAPPVRAAPPPAPAAAPARWRLAAGRLRDTGAHNVLALARRDLAALFLWPLAYAIWAAIIVPVTVLGYLLPVLTGRVVTMEGVFGWAALVTAVLVPLVTMRLLAAERGSGALEQLLSTPVRPGEVVAARWLAGFGFFLAGLAFTLVDVALLAAFQPGFDAGAVAAGYLGILLVGAAWVALGLLASSLTENRVIAVVAGVVVLLFLQLLAGAAASIVPPPLSDLLDYVSAANRALAFERGQVVLRDVVYFLGLTAGALVLTARVLASRRWR